MESHPLIDEHWPHLGQLIRTLAALDGRQVTVQAVSSAAPTAGSVSPDLVDEIHEALLRKKRQTGDLGLV